MTPVIGTGVVYKPSPSEILIGQEEFLVANYNRVATSEGAPLRTNEANLAFNVVKRHVTYKERERISEDGRVTLAQVIRLVRDESVKGIHCGRISKQVMKWVVSNAIVVHDPDLPDLRPEDLP